MFWTNIYALSPHIEALLKKEDVTLHELMDQEEIVPECRSQNKMLVDYLSRPEIMQELVNLTTKEPSMDVDERSRYKYPNVACELLTCNVPSLNEKLAGDETLLAKLYSFIDTDEPLNPLLASFFSKTIGVLLTRRNDHNWYSYQFMCLQVLEFLKSRERCVDRLLQHLETSAIMDLVLKLVTKVEGSDMRQNVLNWLDSQQLVQRLIKLLSPSVEPVRHANAAQLLCDMIKLGRYFRVTCTERTEPDPILNTLESEETVALLLETILSGEPIESSIVGGIQVLLVLLGHETNNIGNEGDVQGNSAGEDTNDNEGRIKIQNATLPYLELLQKLLLNPPPKPPVKTTAGLLTTPLGNTRLHVAKLLVALLHTENIEIFRKLASLGTFQILLDLFFKYSWNNFLHTQVEQCLASVINGDWQENSEIIYSHIFVDCKLINRLLDAWEKNDDKNKDVGVRQGYMGHLINIVNNIVKECKKNEFLDTYLKTNPSQECYKQWEELITTDLVDINKTHQLWLGGKPQQYMSGSDDPNDELNQYGQDAYIQQVYANYQTQQITPNFIDHCGFQDDEFNDRDDALQLSNSIDQLTTIPFALNEEDLDKGEELFNKVCQQKQKAGLDESGGAVEWGDEGELTFQTVIDKRDWPSKQQHHDSNSSDEDEDPREMNMEADSTDHDVFAAAWGTAEPLPGNSVLPQVNPWDVTVAEPTEHTGWANFDNFESALNAAVGLKPSETVSANQEVFTPPPPPPPPSATTVSPATLVHPTSVLLDGTVANAATPIAVEPVQISTHVEDTKAKVQSELPSPQEFTVDQQLEKTKNPAKKEKDTVSTTSQESEVPKVDEIEKSKDVKTAASRVDANELSETPKGEATQNITQKSVNAISTPHTTSDDSKKIEKTEKQDKPLTML